MDERIQKDMAKIKKSVAAINEYAQAANSSFSATAKLFGKDWIGTDDVIKILAPYYTAETVKRHLSLRLFPFEIKRSHGIRLIKFVDVLAFFYCIAIKYGWRRIYKGT